MIGSNFAFGHGAADQDKRLVPASIAALLARYQLKLLADTRAYDDRPVMRLVDAATGLSVPRLPAPVIESLGRMVARRRSRRAA